MKPPSYKVLQRALELAIKKLCYGAPCERLMMAQYLRKAAEELKGGKGK